MKISLSNVEYKTKQSKTLFYKKRSVTISLPSENLDRKAIKRGFMPNFIHSMDAAHIHILIDKLLNNKINIPFYTIHDCFATTPNNMVVLNNIIKDSFIELYFEKDYINKMHYFLLEQVKSFNHPKIIIEKINDKEELVKFVEKENPEKVKKILPNLPGTFNWIDNKDLFIKGIKNSKYLIN